MTKDTSPSMVSQGYEEVLVDLDASMAECDEVNIRLMKAIGTITDIFLNEVSHVRPFEAAQMVRPFVEAINLVATLDPEFLRKEFMDFKDLDNEAIGELLMAMPITYETDPNLIDGHLAVDVARVMGPDHGQNWYNFVVLITKLA